jgi:membrane-bound lytic murein transglycosylase C
MLNKLTYISFVFLSFVSGQTDFEKYQKDQKAGLASMAAAENAYMASVSKEFDNYIVEQEQLYQDFKDEVEKKWDAFKFSSSKTYVDYDNDLNARASVDFEKGLVEVEVIVEDDPKQSVVEKKNAGDKKLQKKLTQIIQKKADDDKPLLKDQLENNQGRKVTTSNAKSFAKEIVNQKKVKKVEFEGKDGQKRIKYTLKLKLQPNHVNTRANRFKQDVITQSKRFNIDPAVAFAIMQTESSFNPKARSHIPAYGLMQLVPKSGARDAYNYIYKKDKLLQGAYLYKPANNIELGCAYISKIRHSYFKSIQNENSATYCTISAYNTGIGNVAKSFTGKTKLKPAIQVINSKSPKGVYDHLKRELPYKETRDYLEKVTERMAYYASWQ